MSPAEVLCDESQIKSIVLAREVTERNLINNRFQGIIFDRRVSALREHNMNVSSLE